MGSILEEILKKDPYLTEMAGVSLQVTGLLVQKSIYVWAYVT